VGSRWLPAQPLTDGKFVAAKVLELRGFLATQESSQLKYFSSERLTISRNSCMLSLRLHLLFHNVSWLVLYGTCQRKDSHVKTAKQRV
jgi:hypothetical protein